MSAQPLVCGEVVVTLEESDGQSRLAEESGCAASGETRANDSDIGIDLTHEWPQSMIVPLV
jgi:hypothetical protein